MTRRFSLCALISGILFAACGFQTASGATVHVLGSTGTTDSTTLGGATLPARAGGNARAWYGVERISSLNGWSVGRGGMILGERDGGTSDGAVIWSAEMIGLPRTISDLFAAGFVDSLSRWRELGNEGNLGNEGILGRGDRGSAQTGWTILASHGAIYTNPSTARRIGSGAPFSGIRDGGVRFSMQISDPSRDLFDAESVYLGNSTIDFSPGRLEAAVEGEGNLINGFNGKARASSDRVAEDLANNGSGGLSGSISGTGLSEGEVLLEASSIPEPSRALLGFLGIAAVVLARRRRG